MLGLSDTISLCTTILADSPSAVPFLKSSPGVGKSEACLQIGDNLNIPKDRQLVIHVNNHDVVDFTGVPSVQDGMTIFNPTKMFYDFREGTGPGLIVLEELPQSSNDHQTWAAGFILERETPLFRLDKDVRIIVTGNNKSDKAGARPLLTHLSNRLYEFDVEVLVKDWVDWALKNGIDPKAVSFFNLRPELLNNFDPNKSVNATPRSWTQFFKEVPETLPKNLYFAACSAKVGEAAAVEWVGFKELTEDLPTNEEIRKNPKETRLPKELGQVYAVVTSLAASVEEHNLKQDLIYTARLSKEYQYSYVSHVASLRPDLCRTDVYLDWIIENQEFTISL